MMNGGWSNKQIRLEPGSEMYLEKTITELLDWILQPTLKLLGRAYSQQFPIFSERGT